MGRSGRQTVPWNKQSQRDVHPICRRNIGDEAAGTERCEQQNCRIDDVVLRGDAPANAATGLDDGTMPFSRERAEAQTPPFRRTFGRQSSGCEQASFKADLRMALAEDAPVRRSCLQQLIKLPHLRRKVPRLPGQALAERPVVDRTGRLVIRRVERFPARHRKDRRPGEDDGACPPVQHTFTVRKTDRHVDQRPRQRRQFANNLSQRRKCMYLDAGHVTPNAEPATSAAVYPDVDTGSRIVTSSSAVVGWMPIVLSNTFLVAPAFSATAIP